MTDRLLGGFLLLLALAYIASAMQIEAALVFDSLGPKAFPIVIAICMAVASLYLLIRPDPEPDWPAPVRLLELATALVVLIVYALLLVPLGFVIATALGAAFLSWRLGAPALYAGPVGIGISVGIYAVFHLTLGLSLARGPWGF